MPQRGRIAGSICQRGRRPPLRRICAWQLVRAEGNGISHTHIQTPQRTGLSFSAATPWGMGLAPLSLTFGDATMAQFGDALALAGASSFKTFEAVAPRGIASGSSGPLDQALSQPPGVSAPGSRQMGSGSAVVVVYGEEEKLTPMVQLRSGRQGPRRGPPPPPTRRPTSPPRTS